MSNRIAERASAIRHYLSDHPDLSLVRKYSFVAARFEEMKLAQLKGDTTPAEDVAFREVTAMLVVLTQKLASETASPPRTTTFPAIRNGC
jgi:hypothetical protein